MEKIKGRNVLAGLAGLFVAGATIVGMEKTGLPTAESELQRAKTEAYWGQVPVAKDYYPEIRAFIGRLAWDCLPASMAGMAIYSRLRKKE